MSRLGRNPFENKAEPRRSKRASEILAEEIAETITQQDASPRNAHRASETPQNLLEKIARFFYVDVPAEGFVFGLKAALLVRSAWD